MPDLGRNLYFVFVISWFLHLPARIPVLGALRLDLVLVVILSVIAFTTPKAAGDDTPVTPTDKYLRILIAYAILSIPFVYWPGSVIKSGLPDFIKAVVFYYFTVAFIVSEKDLKNFIFIFITCQVLRVLEPLYLHLADGYWGSQASMRGGIEMLNRLSGGPFDVLNPNGLAFVICTIAPFLYFLSGLSWKHRLALIVLTPPCLYALALTGSRSGLIALGIVGLGILIKARHRLALALLFLLIAGVGFSLLSTDMQDRYLSTIGLGQKNAATAGERYAGMEEQFLVVLHRPLFGHGLGTSPEANFHFSTAGPYRGKDMPAHNLYLEIAQELGIFGVIIYVLFIKSIVGQSLRSKPDGPEASGDEFVPRLINAMQVWLAMNLIFSFASYGLSSYDWYLFGGLSVVVARLTSPQAAESNGQGSSTKAPRARAGARRGMGRARGNR